MCIECNPSLIVLDVLLFGSKWWRHCTKEALRTSCPSSVRLTPWSIPTTYNERYQRKSLLLKTKWICHGLWESEVFIMSRLYLHFGRVYHKFFVMRGARVREDKWNYWGNSPIVWTPCALYSLNLSLFKIWRENSLHLKSHYHKWKFFPTLFTSTTKLQHFIIGMRS